MALLLVLIEASILFFSIIVIAAIIGKTAGKFFDNDPR